MSRHSSPPPELIAAIHRGQRFYVTSHQRPDGDAIGSAVGMALALQALGKQATVVMDGVPPAFLQPFPHVDAIRATTEVTDTVDAVLVMECSSLARTGVAGLDRSPVINIDHHPGNTGYGAINWIDETAAACGEQVFTLLDALGVPLSADIATHLYLAILTDTGSFHFSHLTPRTYELAARAVAAGADPQWIARTHYDSNSLARVRIFGAVLNGMAMHADGRVALLTITQGAGGGARRHLRRHRGADQLPAHGEGRAGGGVLQGVGARRLARQPALQGRGRHRRDCQAVRRRRPHERLGLRLAGHHRRRPRHLCPAAGRRRGRMISGVLVLDKPQGPTSHDMVAVARRALGERRIGHCGTLDPMATGVLALAVGQATRLVQFLSSEEKHYDAVVTFGRDTNTYDATGDTVAESSDRPTREALIAALDRFRGTFAQLPPAYSAKKIGGVRAYHLARREDGATLDLKPVMVTVAQLELLAFDGDRATLAMRVSAGFYVRSLAHDLGRALGMGATLEALRRTRAGDFGLDDAVTVETDGDERRRRPGRADDSPVAPAPGTALARADAGGGRLRPPRHGPAAAGRLGRGAGAGAAAGRPGRPARPGQPRAKRPGFLHPSVVLG